MENRDRIRSVGEQPVSDWARTEARHAAETGRQVVEDTKRGAQHYAAEAKGMVQDAVQQTRDYVEDTVQQARDKMAEYREGGFEKVKHDVAGYTREQPMTALLIAAGAGLVLGWLSAARR